ncbi:MAG: GvpL/GvpF family gas vesicle protein [Rhodospirillaceae bacterium]|nr:MAG: GvpL/GvpF family gas vesicle protein [Rhodospirillaceae bacterium]
MLYLYAVAKSQGRVPFPAVRGFDAAPLYAFSVVHDLMVAVSDLARGVVPATGDALYTHEQAIAALMPWGTVLPMRFGTIVNGPAACRDRLADFHDVLRADLARVRGCVEFGVRLIPLVEPEAASDTAPGCAAPPISAPDCTPTVRRPWPRPWCTMPWIPMPLKP